MKIYSWNIYFHNKQLGKAFTYIKSLDFDVLCLQEVPEDFLKRLEKLPYQIASAVDIAFSSHKKKRTIYSVILSRHPIVSSKEIIFPEADLPFRALLLLKARSRWAGYRYHGSVYADIKIKKNVIRFFSLHLTLTGPSDRRKEFEVVKDFLPKKFPAIIAGDFNTIESPLTKPLNWFVGSKISEATPWYRERKRVEAEFKNLRLKNPLRGKITHNILRSQLDHIVVPQSANVLNAEVVKRTYGSDHHPVLVEIAD